MIAWRAALHAGFSSAEQYLESIDSDEWTECLAFYELDRFGEEIADARYAKIMALISAAHGDSNAKPINFSMFHEPDEELVNLGVDRLTNELDAMFGVSNGDNHS